MTTPETSSNTSLRDSVLNRIQGGKVRMHSRLYFLLRIVGTLVLAFLVLLISSLIVSFILFALIQTGQHTLLGFGLQGVLMFMMLFPWPLVLLDLLCIIGLLKLLSGFSLVYRIPHLPVYLGLGFVVVLFGAFLTLTPLHPMLLQRADRNELPVLGEVYEGIYDTRPEGGVFHVRVATSTNDELLVVRDDRDRTQGLRLYNVVAQGSSSLPHFLPGQYILIFGTQQGREIEARRIQILPPPPPRSMHP